VEVAATPRAGRLEVGIWFKPGQVAGGCLTDCSRDRCGDDRHRRYGDGYGFGDGHDGDDDDHHHGDHDDDGDCPQWLVAVLEPPAGTPVNNILVSSVRLGGSVAPDPNYRRYTDSDHDGLPELKLRFRWSAVRALLAVGANTLRVQGRTDTAEFEGTGLLLVTAPDVRLRIAPRTLSGNHGSDVEARLSFEGCLHGRDVDTASLRLNGAVAVKRVVGTPGSDLIVKFPRAAVRGVLPAGERVEVRVTGTVDGLPFAATDFIRVIQ
jgi:hypothetical protein